jgi:hypothetical protein
MGGFATQTCHYIMKLECSLEALSGVLYVLIRSINEGNPYDISSITTLIRNAISSLPSEYTSTITYSGGLVATLHQLVNSIDDKKKTRRT